MFLEILFILSAILTVVGAISVVLTKNLMHSCVFLLGSLFGVAGLYATLGADFVAAAQLVVYAGGVVILMLFAIMLTGGTLNNAGKFAFLKVPAMGNLKTYTLGGLTSVVIALVIGKIIWGVRLTAEIKDLPAFESTVEKIGMLLVTDHVLAFEISSVLLLGALVGAAVIARPRRN